MQGFRGWVNCSQSATSRCILLAKATGKLTKDLSPNDTHMHFKCPHAAIFSMIWWLKRKRAARGKKITISTKLEPQILAILPAKAWGFLKKLVVHKKEKPTPFRLPWEVSQAAFPSVEYRKPGRPCRLLPLESRPCHWKKSPWGPSLPGLTYLDVICLVRMGMELMGMDKKTGLGWPKGDELTGLGS